MQNNMFEEVLNDVLSNTLRISLKKEGFEEVIGDFKFARESDLSWVVFHKGKKIYDSFEDGYESPTCVNPNYLTLKKCKDIVRKKIKNGDIKLT